MDKCAVSHANKIGILLTSLHFVCVSLWAFDLNCFFSTKALIESHWGKLTCLDFCGTFDPLWTLLPVGKNAN